VLHVRNTGHKSAYFRELKCSPPQMTHQEVLNYPTGGRTCHNWRREQRREKCSGYPRNPWQEAGGYRRHVWHRREALRP